MNAILTFLKNFEDPDLKPIRSAKIARQKFIEKTPEIPLITSEYKGATVIPRPEHNV